MSILFSGYSQQCSNKNHSNQDKFGVIRVKTPNDSEITMAIVSDGISSGFEGKYASYNTILWSLEWASIYFSKHDFEPEGIADEFEAHLISCNHRLNQFSDEHSDRDTCCTICGIITNEQQLMVFNAGDSRLYELISEKEIRLMTVDDRAEDGHSIAMHIGGKEDNEIDITFSLDDFHPNSQYVICSDGFYRRVDFSACYSHFVTCQSRSDTINLLKRISQSLVLSGETDDITALVLTGK